ncbi:lipopolysaccharide biosynthesis protein [Allomuricauda sp. NBRC 101325]|uniref:lipopolysaccharide biosynthesis protein n=1 Tax=Allomuricauda sp. NBRC 101325 TaxID=1113758 RepID=UPI0024A29C91|nr:lipopolysaccharide biosynthesis protein [Muricauda sp. NBRC 101325]GLU43210.1 hypothetical protein Musp01_08340 [Muricauda sp. NBRC 101325]
MKINTSVILKNSIYLISRVFIGIFLNLYISRLVLRALGEESFGVFSIVAGLVVMMTFLNNAMAIATERFIAFEQKAGDELSLKLTFRTCLLIHLIIAAAIFVLLETIGVWFVQTKINIGSISDAEVLWLYQFSVFSVVVSMLQIPFKASIIAHERFNVFSFIFVFDLILKLGGAVILTYLTDLLLPKYGLILLIISVVVFSAYFVYSKMRFREVSIRPVYEKDIFKKVTIYTSWSLFGNLAHMASTQGLNILLNLFFGPSINASMAIAIQVQSALKNLAVNAVMAMNPQIIKKYATKDYEEMKMLVFAGAKFGFFAILIALFPIYLETEFFLSLWLGTVPIYAVVFTKILLTVILIDSLSETIKTSIQATGNIKTYQIIVGSILLLNFPLSYLFLKIGIGPESILLISTALSILALGARLLLFKKYLPFSANEYLFGVLIYCIPIIVIAAVFYTVFTNMPETFPKAINLLISLTGLLFFVIQFGLNRKEKKFLFKKGKLILSKLKRL